MFTTERDKPPRRPVITSLAGALGEIKNWLKENQLDQVRDADGMVWDLSVKVHQVPNPADPKGLLWQIRLGLTADATIREFLQTGALDARKDARLLELIGEHSIKIAMKPMVYDTPDEEAARRLVADLLPKLKANFLKNSLTEVKRTLIGRWVDEQGRFGSRAED
jgi:hypothetical protein